MNIAPFRNLNLFPLFDGEDLAGGGGGGTPAPATTGATPAAATPAAPAQAATTPAAAAPSQAAHGDEAMVPSYRLRQTREAAIRQANEQFAAREQVFRQQLEQAEARIRALVGVNPPEDPQIDGVRSQFARLYPGLAGLEERAAQLQEFLERAGDFETQNNHYWTSYGRQTMDAIFKAAEETYGAPLNEAAKRQIHTAFVGYVQSSPENTQRYASDPSIASDFWKEFSSNFVDPIRRGQSAAVATRAAAVANLPQNDGSGNLSTAAAAAPKPANLDERTANAWAAYQARTQK